MDKHAYQRSSSLSDLAPTLLQKFNQSNTFIFPISNLLLLKCSIGGKTKLTCREAQDVLHIVNFLIIAIIGGLVKLK